MKLNTLLTAMALAGFLALLPSTRAQDGKPKDVDAMVTVQRLKLLHAALNLSGDQQEKIRPLLYEEGKSIRAVRESEKFTQQEKIAKQKELHENCMAKIKPILPAEQKAKLENMQQQRASKTPTPTPKPK